MIRNMGDHNIVIAKIKRNAVRFGGISGVNVLCNLLLKAGIDFAAAAAEDSSDAGIDFLTLDPVPLQVIVDTLTNFGIVLTKADISSLGGWLDRNVEGLVRPSVLCAALRQIGASSAQRSSLVARLCDFLCALELSSGHGKPGCVRLSTLKTCFTPERHPDVCAGLRTEQHIAEDFLGSLANVSVDADGENAFVPIESVEALLAGLSAMTDSDERFAAIMRGVWNLPHFDAQRTMELMYSARHCPPALATRQLPIEKESILLEKTMAKAFDDTIASHRKMLLATEEGFRALGCSLRRRDPDLTGFISVTDFGEALSDVRLFVTYPPVLSLMDVEKNGTVDYLFYLAAVVGDLPAERKILVERLWRDCFNKVLYTPAGQGAVPVSAVNVALLHQYVTVSGKHERQSHFLDAWDRRTCTGGPASSFCLQRELTAEWFIPLSHRIPNDTNFEKMMEEQWRLEVPKFVATYLN